MDEITRPDGASGRRLHGSHLPHRMLLLEHVDRLLSQVAADWRHELAGWQVEAHLVERTEATAVGELLAVRVIPPPAAQGRRPRFGRSAPTDLDSFLDDLGGRVSAVLWQITAVVADVATQVPELSGIDGQEGIDRLSA